MTHFRILSVKEASVSKQKQIISNYTKHKKNMVAFIMYILAVCRRTCTKHSKQKNKY